MKRGSRPQRQMIHTATAQSSVELGKERILRKGDADG
jgi:hypothetical protein